MTQITFRYLTGLKRNIFDNVHLKGSWDWSTSIPMQKIVAEDGCPAFKAVVELHGNAGQEFQWGVSVSTAARQNVWGIMPEICDRNSAARVRSFPLSADATQQVCYYLTYARRLGAQKHYAPVAAGARLGTPGIRFAVWAPNAKKVEVVMGKT